MGSYMEWFELFKLFKYNLIGRKGYGWGVVFDAAQ